MTSIVPIDKLHFKENFDTHFVLFILNKLIVIF